MKILSKILVLTALMPMAASAADLVAGMVQGNGAKVLNVYEDELLRDSGLKAYLTSQGIVYGNPETGFMLVGQSFANDGQTEPYIFDTKVHSHALNTLDFSFLEAKAVDEKGVAYVFSDITCGWCGKLHSEIDKMNSLGLTVRVIPFSRSNDVHVKKQLTTIMASSDPLEYMNNAFKGSMVQAAASVSDKIELNQQLARVLSVSGSPNIFVDGYKIDGYMQSEKIVALALALKKQSEK
ncbi:DsbC family protein [Vibrio barjaei]|uniref:DsbC family protein n=1 Tax=Vibrio barjaei TaxID=1676683 RepID=UPI002283C562|nr:DsbC family protein [Vibrio barjaei]MCY9874555.1 DsbC family protein [Vibrio barjaei]